MAEPGRRRVTLTLTLTDEELAGLTCDDLVLERIATLAVLAVAPPSPVSMLGGTRDPVGGMAAIRSLSPPAGSLRPVS